jgi:hypothetical protein
VGGVNLSAGPVCLPCSAQDTPSNWNAVTDTGALAENPGRPLMHWDWYQLSGKFKLTSWSWALLEKPPIVQLLENFPAFYGTRMFSTLHCSLSWAISIQSIPPNPISLRSILILSIHIHLGLPGGLFPSGFFHKNPIWVPFVLHALPISSTSTYYSNYTWRSVQVMKLLIM